MFLNKYNEVNVEGRKKKLILLGDCQDKPYWKATYIAIISIMKEYLKVDVSKIKVDISNSYMYLKVDVFYLHHTWQVKLTYYENTCKYPSRHYYVYLCRL